MSEVEQDMTYPHCLDDDEDKGKLCFYTESDLNDSIRTVIQELERNFETIRSELNNICQNDFMKWVETICKDGWTVFGLYGFGRKLPENTVKCPKTTLLIEELFERLGLEITTAGFSSLHPGTYISPHRGYEGYSDNVLRLHLGLVVPDDKCGIRVGNQKRRWHEGKCLVFDDFITHEAWNFGETTRINLLLDIKYTEKDYMVKRRLLLEQQGSSGANNESSSVDDANNSNDIDCRTANFSAGLKGVLDHIDKTHE